MDIRKVYKGGANQKSFLVTLPADQLKAIGVEAGNFVSADLVGQTIVISPVQKKEKAN